MFSQKTILSMTVENICNLLVRVRASVESSCKRFGLKCTNLTIANNTLPKSQTKWGYKIFVLMNVHEIVYNFDIYCGKILYVLKSNNNILLYWQTFKSDLSVFRKGNGRKHLQSVGAGSSISGVIVQKIWPQMHKLDNCKQYIKKENEEMGL